MFLAPGQQYEFYSEIVCLGEGGGPHLRRGALPRSSLSHWKKPRTDWKHSTRQYSRVVTRPHEGRGPRYKEREATKVNIREENRGFQGIFGEGR